MTLLNRLIYINWEQIDWGDLPQWITKNLPRSNGQSKEYSGTHYNYIVIKHTTSGMGNGHQFSLYGYEAYRKVKA
jgi:hypothetical protein